MFQAILDKIVGKEISSKIQHFLLRGSFWSFVLQLGLSLLTFLTSLIIAWTTGDQGFGIYSLVFTWISLWSMIALFGLDDLLLRQIPIYTSQNDIAAQEHLFQWINKVLIISNLVTLGFFAIAIYFLPTF